MVDPPPMGTIYMKHPWGFHEKGTFSVHSFNVDYLSIPERPGSYKYLFHEIPVMIRHKLNALWSVGESAKSKTCKVLKQISNKSL